VAAPKSYKSSIFRVALCDAGSRYTVPVLAQHSFPSIYAKGVMASGTPIIDMLSSLQTVATSVVSRILEGRNRAPCALILGV
jgi:hypothetical protein